MPSLHLKPREEVWKAACRDSKSLLELKGTGTGVWLPQEESEGRRVGLLSGSKAEDGRWDLSKLHR